MNWTSACSLPRTPCLASALVILVLLSSAGLANPLPVTGACCFVDGECQVLFQYDCEAAGGSYEGDFTSCEPNPCSPAHFACCLPDGNCLIMTSPPLCEGQGGTVQPAAECFFELCPEAGPCCFPDGHCEFLTEAACIGLWGGWLGSGYSSCNPNPCPPCLLPCLSDACCLPDGSCVPTSSTTCLAHGGTWQGFGSVCSPDPCQTSSAPPEPGAELGRETRSWGQLKRTYR